MRSPPITNPLEAIKSDENAVELDGNVLNFTLQGAQKTYGAIVSHRKELSRLNVLTMPFLSLNLL